MKSNEEKLQDTIDYMIKENKDLYDQLTLAIKTLDYYASKSNWRETNPNNRPSGMTYFQTISSRDSGHAGPEQYDFAGGKRSRETLKKLNKL